jgi:hypothetical protein
METEMKKIVLTLGVVSALAAAQAFAETAITDTDGSGTYSMEELKAAFPDLTEEAFGEADANSDGQVDADELQAAQEAEIIPM